MARGFHIRAPRPEDAPALARLVAANNRSHDLPDDRFTEAVALRDLFGSRPILRARIAEAEGGGLIGAALWCDAYESAFAARGGYLCDLHVVASARRRGVGRALVAAVARAVRQEGGVYLWWASQRWNHEAHAFYAALGAGEEGVQAHALTEAAFARLCGEAAPAD